MLPDFELSCSMFSENGLTLTKSIYDKLSVYSDFLVEYNKKVNLTAITKPEEILVKHFIDSIALLNYVDIPEGSTLIDVGTGAGFPSVPLKIYRQDIEITLLDSLNKRIVFLNELCSKLSIDAEFIHGRAEDISKLSEYREKFDFATARAVANMSLLSELCLPFVKVGGKFVALKGPSEDISLGFNAIKILGGNLVNETEYKIGNEERKIVEVNKISQTSTKYPRNSSQIKKKLL